MSKEKSSAASKPSTASFSNKEISSNEAKPVSTSKKDKVLTAEGWMRLCLRRYTEEKEELLDKMSTTNKGKKR